MSNWLDKIVPARIRSSTVEKTSQIPEGLWTRCSHCQVAIYHPELEKNLYVCPKCQYHHRVDARQRADMMLDANAYRELFSELKPIDKLKFRDVKKYKERLNAEQKKTQESDALIVFDGTIASIPVTCAIFEFSFMGGSMGQVVGEKFALACEHSLENKQSLICFAASGGARMQEGLFSLMQMAKTSSALEQLKQASTPYISILTDPVFGGVSASLAMLGDIILAEPKALIGFAGPRVIEQTVREKLPDGFQRAEFLLEHGMIDQVVQRKHLKNKIATVLSHLTQSYTK